MTDEDVERIALKAGFTSFALGDPMTKARIRNVIRIAQDSGPMKDLLKESAEFIESAGEAWFKRGKGLVQRIREAVK